MARDVFHGHRGQLRKHYQVGQENQLDTLGIMILHRRSAGGRQSWVPSSALIGPPVRRGSDRVKELRSPVLSGAGTYPSRLFADPK